jgi:hypothetical protein
MEHSKDIQAHKAVSMNAMHSSMTITDEFYSNLNDSEVQNRIGSLSKSERNKDRKEDIELFEQFLAWRERLLGS